MSKLRAWILRFGGLFNKQCKDRELDDEIESHLQMHIEDNLRLGMTPEEARREAMIKLGGVESTKEAYRDQRGLPVLETLWQDVRYGARMLRKSPGFTVVAVFTLALGIGANTAIFSVVNAVLLRPLPYEMPNQLVWLSELAPDGDELPIAYPNYQDWRSQQNVFDHMGVYKRENAALTGFDEPAQMEGARVSAGLLASLAVQPVIGRLFLPEEDNAGAAPTVLISHALWKSRFAASPETLNKALKLNDQPHSIVGVMPEHFAFPNKLDYWVPAGLMVTDRSWQNRNNRPGLFGIARLKAGITLEQAQAELDQIAIRLEQEYPESNKARRIQIEPLHQKEVGGVRRALWTLLGAAGLVLLIACANMANLSLARSTGRQKEMALRSALGARRSRIIRQLLTESVLLAVIGGATGLLFAVASLRLLASLVAAGVPRADEIGLDGSVLLFSAIVALVTGILFGLAPAWQAVRADLQGPLKDAGRGATGRSAIFRHGLVVAEVALTLLLLVGSGLLLRSFHRLQTLDPGFASDNVLSFEINLPQRKYSDANRSLAFYQSLLDKLRVIPGVQAASVSLRVPLETGGRSTSFVVEGQPVPPPHERPLMNVQVVGPDYFRVVGTPVLRGRPFTERDNREHLGGSGREGDWASGLNVIIIDEDFAKRHWPNADPIGRRIRMASRDDTPWMTVVGVVPKIKWRRLKEEGGLVQGYLSFLQSPQPGMKALIKTTANLDSVVAAARKAVASIDPDQPIHNVQTFAQLRERNTGNQRLNLTLLGLFGLIALALAIVGLYGVLAYGVSQRRREIGVRMALGAQRRDVLSLVVGQGMKLALIGTLIGIAGAFAFTRVLRNLLFQVVPTDPVTFAAIPMLLVAVSALACWIPAHSAARVNPMEALRNE